MRTVARECARVGRGGMTNDLRIYGENICAFPHILGSSSSYMTLHPIRSEFVFFFISVAVSLYSCLPCCLSAYHLYSTKACQPVCLSVLLLSFSLPYFVLYVYYAVCVFVCQSDCLSDILTVRLPVCF
jgi:hypothetical protein